MVVEDPDAGREQTLQSLQLVVWWRPLGICISTEYLAPNAEDNC